MRYVVADIRLSEAHTKQVQVPPWELPILEAVHGSAVTVVDETEVDREPPEARDEYERLANRYSSNKEESNSAVAAVYGTFERGIEALEKEIDKAGSSKSNVKNARLKAFDEKAKTEREAFEKRQEDERKEIERDIKAREAAAKRAEKEAKPPEEKLEVTGHDLKARESGAATHTTKPAEPKGSR